MAEVTNDATRSRFEIDLPEGPAALDYRLEGDRLVLLHTGVPEDAEGQGHGAALVRAALEHARAEGLRVVPLCQFARAYLERHPQYGELVETEG